MSGDLCRCAVNPGIVTAVRDAAGHGRMRPFECLGAGQAPVATNARTAAATCSGRSSAG